MSKRKYTLDLLTKTSMLGCKPADTPTDSNQKFRKRMVIDSLILVYTGGW